MAQVRNPLGKPGYSPGGNFFLLVELLNVSSGKIALPLAAGEGREPVAPEVCVSWAVALQGNESQDEVLQEGQGQRD